MNDEGTARQLRIDNPHLDGWAIPRSTTLDEYLAGRAKEQTYPCYCAYCQMTDDEVLEYRQNIRGKHAEKETS